MIVLDIGRLPYCCLGSGGLPNKLPASASVSVWERYFVALAVLGPVVGTLLTASGGGVTIEKEH
jgi:hypothetical protein